MTRTRTALTVAALAASTALLPACGLGDPCGDLPAPTAQEQELAASGVELEREGSWDAECELVDGTWQQD